MLRHRFQMFQFSLSTVTVFSNGSGFETRIQNASFSESSVFQCLSLPSYYTFFFIRNLDQHLVLKVS